MSILKRFVNLFRAERVSNDIEREMRFHLEERADELRSRGLSEADALREAKRRFGNTTYHVEGTRDANMLTWLESLVGDLRYAVRNLLNSPVFAAVAVVSLALGIGANTAIFSLMNAVMLRSLPVRHPEELVRVTLREDGSDEVGDAFTNPLWESLRDRQDVFSGVFAYGNNTFNLADDGAARLVAGSLVSGDFFNTLGVHAAAGRLLGRADDFRGCPGGAVISHGLWRREYNGDHGAIGRMISINGHRFPIVGVTDASFYGPIVGTSMEAYLPICAEAVLAGQNSMLDRRLNWWLRVMGRPVEGMSLARVQSRLAALAPAVVGAAVPETYSSENQAAFARGHLSADAAPGGISSLRQQYDGSLRVLMGIVALVLLIACANVGNLLLARASSREREMSVRLALGAARSRLVRQIITECLLLSTLGALLGVAFARWGSALLVRLLSTHNDAVSLDLRLDWRILAFMIAVTTFTGLLFGLVPAWRASRTEPQTVMKASARSIVEGHSRFGIGKAMVVGQIALSLILVMGAALLLGSFRTLATTNPGFVANDVLLAAPDLGRGNIPPSRRHQFYNELLRQTRAMPGVKSAATASITPISGTSWNAQILVDGFTRKSDEDALSWVNQVSDGFFTTFSIPFLAGRDFNSSDTPASPKVAVVNEAFAKHFFGTTDVIGRQYASMGPRAPTPPIRIVGVVSNSKYDDLKKPMEPVAYLAMSQDTGPSLLQPQLAYSTNGDVGAVMRAIQAVAASIDGASSVQFVRMDVQMGESIQRERILAVLSGFFGTLALLLAMIGLYGIMSYSVSRRRSEIGIRMALGSARVSVIGMVMREVGTLVSGGLVIGTIGAVAVLKVLQSLLFNLSPTDPRVLAMSALTLASVAVIAGAIPAWRAGRVDPMDALREDGR